MAPLGRLLLPAATATAAAALGHTALCTLLPAISGPVGIGIAAATSVVGIIGVVAKEVGEIPSKTRRAIVGTVGALLMGGAATLIGTVAHIGLCATAASICAPIGIGVALATGVVALGGLTAGIAAEMKTKAGRVLGGLTGSIVGSACGALAGLVGWRPAPALADLVTGFSIKSLPSRLRDKNYFAYPPLRDDARAQEALRSVLPGDILVAHHENVFDGAAITTRLAGAHADFTHPGLVTDRGTVLELLEFGPKERPIQKWLKFPHLAVLRPQYATLESRLDTIKDALQMAQRVTYNDALKLRQVPDPDGRPKEYCTEFVYNRLREKAPEIRLQEQVFSPGTGPLRLCHIPFVTPDIFFDSPDIEVVYNSGSHFWLNWLSRYC